MPSHTIAAISTPSGPGAIGMVRLSGPDAISIAERVFRPFSPPALGERSGYSGAPGRILADQTAVDDGVAFLYRAPKSYTGEDVVELCCHGGSFAATQLLRLCLAAGAHPAAPGEFTKRAFLNGKLDLSQAEAVADLIGAQGSDAMRAAYAAREGALSRRIGEILTLLTTQAAQIAAWSDYPEEDLAPVDDAALLAALEDASSQLETLLGTYHQGRLLGEGIRVAIVGKPNVGKSTLMNLLAGEDRSIVTDQPGTTRDVVRDSVNLGGMTLHLMDTAGIRETEDVIEKIGVDRALSELESADLILAVFDHSSPQDERDRLLRERLSGKRVVILLNKIDLPAFFGSEELRRQFPEVVSLSAKTGEGRDALEQAVRRVLELSPPDSSAAMLFHERQKRCVEQALSCVRDAVQAQSGGMTLDAVGVCIEGALDELLTLTGKRASEAVVDEVFARFCVGK